MKKKIISLVLAVSLCAGLLAGCGKEKPKDTDQVSTEDTQTKETKSSESSQEAEQPAEETNQYGDTGGLTLPLVDKPTTITWMVPSSVQDLSNKAVIKEIEARTGVTLDIQTYPSTSFADKLKVTLASGSIPDIITGGNVTEINNLGGQGAFVAINEHLDSLPNFKSLYVDNGENNWVMKSYSNDEGNIYTWPVYGLSRDVNHGFLYRKDIFDQHGIKEWTTTEEFYQALKQLKEIYPDSIPYASKTQDAIFKDWGYGWGIGTENANYPVYYDEGTKTWKLSTIQPEFKEMIDFMKKLYNEGLLDPEFITDTDASWTAKMTAENTSFVTFDWIGRLDMFYEQVKGTIPTYDLRYANPVGPTGNVRSLSKVINFGIAVANNKNAEVALKVLDYLSSPSGSELITLGIEGEHYTLDAEGKVTYPNITDVDKVDIKTLEERYGAWVEGMYLNIDPRSTYFNYTEKEQESQDKINNGMKYEALDPVLKFTNEETSKIAELKTTIQKAGVEFAVQYVLDKNYGESQWNEWLGNAEKLGASELESAYNTAQARFNAE